MKSKLIKKIVLGVMVVVMLLSIAGCSNNRDEEANEENGRKEEVLKVGMELKWPPFETIDGAGNPEGISVMLAEELGDYLGREVEIVDMPFGSLISGLETEKIDLIIGSMSITEDRKEKINFSNPYMYFKILSVVNNESNISGYDDLFEKEGLVFVAPKSFATLDIAREKANNPTIREFDDKATATLELANGNADVFMVDAVGAVSIAKNYPNDLTVIYDPVETYPIGMGIRKDDTDLLEKVNEFITKSEELGVYDRIGQEYNDVLNDLVGKGLEFYLNED